MNAEVHYGSGNKVVFLIAAAYNILLNISYGALTEYAVYALVGNAIGALIWFLFKRLNDRIENKRKKNRIRKLRIRKIRKEKF